MSVGKASAQAAHAAVIATINSSEKGRQVWLKSIHKTIIVLEARDDNHIIKLKQYLSDRGIRLHEIIDEGVNEIDPHTTTALASNILDKEAVEVIQAFSTFNLFREVIKINLEFEK